MKDMRDVALMGYVLEEFDSAELVLNSKGEADITNAFIDKNGKPSKMIKFTKEINGVQHVVVATPENGHKKLWVLSEYIEQKKKDTSQTSHGKQALPPTPEANPDNVSSKDSISEKQKKATKRSSLNENVKIAEKMFAEEYDAWDKTNPTEVFKVAVTSEALKEIGIDDKTITMDSVE